MSHTESHDLSAHHKVYYLPMGGHNTCPNAHNRNLAFNLNVLLYVILILTKLTTQTTVQGGLE